LAVEKHKNKTSEEISFGRLFKILRAERGISLKTVSDETRIALSTLHLIEDEAYDKLPDPVFVKGFLRSYAEMMELDADRTIQNYLAGRHHYYQSLQFEASLRKNAKSFWPRLFLSVGLFACIILASIAMLKNHNGNSPSETAVPPPKTTLQADIAPLSESDTRKPVEPKETPGGYQLQIEAIEETWLKVITDRRQPKQYNLNPGDRLELTATSGYNLLIGNATGVRLRLNHQPVAVEGRHGQVVTLKLPR
jgi:cytoskeletal protein RodZ